MSNEEEKKCPLCAEEMDWTDQQLKPCKCGYEVCVWCWHHIMDMAEKDATEGLCPACRTPYDKNRIVGLESSFQRVANNSVRKQKQPKPKQKPNEGRKDLSDVRVIQRKMAYIIGLPLSLADEDFLQRNDYFGRYGKVTKVSLSRTAGGTVQQFVNDTCSVYITYSKNEEAVRCSGPEVASGDLLSSSKDKNGVVKSLKHMTSFVDIVEWSCSSDSDKNISSSVSVGLCSNVSSIPVNSSSHDEAEGSDLVSSKSTGKLYNEPFREASSLPLVELGDLTLKDTNITKQESGLVIDSQNSLNSVEVIKNYSENGYGVNNNANSLLNNGYNEKRYGESKSFFNEEIVEHLRRLNDSSLVDDDENSAAVESSIISNILSMDFDGCDDSVLPQTVTGLFDGKDGRHGPSWSFQNSDHSRFSFANETSLENKDRAYKPSYQTSRAQSGIPPGFSKPKPPPGFSSGMRTEQVVSVSSGSYVNNSLPNNHYPMPSIGSLSNSSDDLINPAIVAVRRGNSSSLNTRSSTLNEDTKLWLLMQQQQQSASATHHHHEPQISLMQQCVTPRFLSSRDDYYGDQSYTQQQYPQPNFSNGHVTNGYRQLYLNGGQQVNTRSEVGGLQEQIHRNERFGLEKLLPVFGDYKFQMPSSGDVYTRVFGM